MTKSNDASRQASTDSGVDVGVPLHLEPDDQLACNLKLEHQSESSRNGTMVESAKKPPSSYLDCTDSSVANNKRLSIETISEDMPVSAFDNLSYGLRIRLGRNLQETHRNSFAHQVQQISRSYSTQPLPAEWGAEISQPLSALYAILVVIISSCLAFSSQMTTNVDGMYSRYFDTALLAMAIIFLAASFVYLYRKRKFKSRRFSFRNAASESEITLHRSSSEPKLLGTVSGYFRSEAQWITDNVPTHKHTLRVAHTEVDSASFYLKMGALSFAIGSMIYACLELGVFMENTSCFNTVMGLNPVLFIGFVVLQLYFIFLNSRLALRKHRTLGRFGLMHLVATNLCIWIRTLIDETLHAFGKYREQKERLQRLSNVGNETGTLVQNFDWMEDLYMGKEGGYNPLCVDVESIMKKMMEEASVFLYPCIIEYALISAGITYIMWTFVGHEAKPATDATKAPMERIKRTYAIDCDQAAKGLFVGLLVAVLTIVSLILYFLFLEKAEYVSYAVFQAQITEISLYAIGLLAVFYAFMQIAKNLRRAVNRTVSSKLDETLLKISMMGVYAYSVLSILGGYAEYSSTGIFSIVAAGLCLIQSTAQTVFIFDASQRTVICQHVLQRTSDDKQTTTQRKPARETVTLLLIINFALWATNVFCTLRAASSPTQTEFYGMHEWTVMLHVTVPLVIFYRFHSTACLFEIWKRAYKEKRPFLAVATASECNLTEYVTNV